MRKAAVEISVCLAGSALLLLAVYSFRPIFEMSPVRQVKGTEITRPYLGRMLEVADGDQVSQTFTAPADGLLNGFAVYTPIPNRQSSGSVKAALYKGGSKVFEQTNNISRLANNEGPSIWRFRPIKIFKGERFAIRLTSRATPALFVFFNSRGDAYKGGTAFLGERRLKVDLAFQIFYKLDGQDYWRHLAKKTPNLIGPAPLLAVLFFTWLAAAALFWRLLKIKQPLASLAKGPGSGRWSD